MQRDLEQKRDAVQTDTVGVTILTVLLVAYQPIQILCLSFQGSIIDKLIIFFSVIMLQLLGYG
jgi:hypothetical protein